MTPERLQTISQVLAFLGVVLAGFGTLGSWWFDRKAQEQQDAQRVAYEDATTQKLDSLLAGNAELQDRLRPFEALARQRFPDLPADEAMDRLSKEVAGLREQTRTIARTVRQFSGEVSFTLGGEWSSPLVKGGSRSLGERRDQPYIALRSNDPAQYPTIEMNLLDMRRENLDEATARVWLRAETPGGHYPLGADIGVLEHYRALDIALPLVGRAESANGELTISRTTIDLHVNGTSIFRRDEQLPIRVVLPETGWRVVTIEYRKPVFKEPDQNGPAS